MNCAEKKTASRIKRSVESMARRIASLVSVALVCLKKVSNGNVTQSTSNALLLLNRKKILNGRISDDHHSISVRGGGSDTLIVPVGKRLVSVRDATRSEHS